MITFRIHANIFLCPKLFLAAKQKIRLRMNIIPNCNVFPSISASFSPDETKYKEANHEEHKRSSSTLCNFNRAPDSNGGSAVIIGQMYRSTISLVETVTKLKKFNRQYKHSWNYTSHPTIIIWHPSKEWTIAILLKLLLIVRGLNSSPTYYFKHAPGTI